MMDFYEVLEQVLVLLQRHGRVSYRALKRQFALDDDFLNDLKEELIEIQQCAHDQDDKMLVWVGDMGTASLPPPSVPVSASTSPARSQDRDPEAAQQLLDPAIHLMMDAVYRFEGTVNQVLGDGIMALFGAPISHEDHAARACYAALAMQAAMRDYTEQTRRTHGIEMRIRVGLHSGEVVVRTIGNDLHMDYSAVGPTTHLAARMEQLATPGSIRLSADALRLVEGLVRVDALGLIPVKGMADPVEVYELTGASPIRSRLQAAVARGLTRFVGRNPELTALHQALQQAEAGHGQVFAMVGEAGVGKSRLVYEFVHSHHTQQWLVLESASVSYGKATPYFPVVDLLKRYVHIEEGDDSRTIRAKVTGHLVTLDESLQETIPALLSLLDVLPEDSPFLQLDPPQRRQRTLNALKRILLRESQIQPLLVVFEDLHWIDSETQVLLDSLVESLPTTQLLLLVNYRPEYQHAWANKTYYTQLRLDPLPSESAEAFLAALIGNHPSLEPLKKLLIERTEGNPFFLEECVRTLVETQVLVGESSAYHLAQEIPTIQVPATVQAVLAARIDRLSQEEKRLLQTAAVIGTEVPFTLLQSVVEMPEEVLYRGLTHLQAAELLYETSLFPERVYTFKHALTHEVAYGSLLHERRRLLHARIVAALEALAGDRLSEQVERLAQHTLRGEIWDKALMYFRQAGAKAMEHSAYQEAVICYEQALQALERLPERRDTVEQAVDLRIELQLALTPLVASEQILDLLHEAESLAKTLNDQRRLGTIAYSIGRHCLIVGDVDQAIASIRRALALETSHEISAIHVQTDIILGRAYEQRGDYRQALEVLQRTMRLLDVEQIDTRYGAMALPSVSSRSIAARCHAELGTFAEGMALGGEGVRMAETIDDPWNLTTAYLGVAYLSLRKGDIGQGISVFERSLTVCKTTQNSFFFPIVAAKLAVAYTMVGRSTEALPLLEQVVEQVDSRSRMAHHTMVVIALGEASLLVGCLESANEFAARAFSLSRNQKQRGNQAWALRLLGDIAMHRDPPDIDQAKTHYQQALTLAKELSMRPLQAHCHRSLGMLYVQAGQLEKARDELSTAIDMYRDMGMTFWLPETEIALANVERR